MKAFLSVFCIATVVWLAKASAAETTTKEPADVAALRAKAEKGEAAAQFDLAVRYYSGKGVPKDDAEVARWLLKAAEQGIIKAQWGLGQMYDSGEGVPRDRSIARNWFRKAAEQGSAWAQYKLGESLYRSEPANLPEAVKWLRKSADQDEPSALYLLGRLLQDGTGVPKDKVEAARLYHKASRSGHAEAQNCLAGLYWDGIGVSQNYVEAYKWYCVAAAQGLDHAAGNRDRLSRVMTVEQIAEAQRLARAFRSEQAPHAGIALSRPEASGTGFSITEDGYFITNQHVAGEGATVRLVTAAGTIAAKVVKVDKANDLALLKAEGKFTALPVITSRGVRLGATAATVGFPNTGLQGFAPKLAKGEIASLAGAQDDARHFQISAPIQPGNSGGALVDERGNVIGVVVAKLSQRAALATSGALAENVNYAVKSSYLLSFLESVPEVAAKLKEPGTQARKFEDVVKSIEQATVLVLVY